MADLVIFTGNSAGILLGQVQRLWEILMLIHWQFETVALFPTN